VDFWVRSQPGLQSEFQDSQSHTETGGGKKWVHQHNLLGALQGWNSSPHVCKHSTNWTISFVPKNFIIIYIIYKNLKKKKGKDDGSIVKALATQAKGLEFKPLEPT
jgi:hypothetical protein